MNIEDIEKYKYWKFYLRNFRYNIWRVSQCPNGAIKIKPLGEESILKTQIDPYDSEYTVTIDYLDDQLWTPVKDI